MPIKCNKRSSRVCVHDNKIISRRLRNKDRSYFHWVISEILGESRTLMFCITRRNVTIYGQILVFKLDLSRGIKSRWRIIRFSRFYTGFPIALSYPHFYKSDPSLLEAIEGLEPKKELHESYFFIQPKSGLPVDLASRFQINMALQSIGHMARVEKFSDFTLPLLWFEIVSTTNIDTMQNLIDNVPSKLCSKELVIGIIFNYFLLYNIIMYIDSQYTSSFRSIAKLHRT